jgi:hypothetical protein
MSILCCSERTCDVRDINFVSVVVANSCAYGESCRSSSIWHLFKLKTKKMTLLANDFILLIFLKSYLEPVL